MLRTLKLHIAKIYKFDKNGVDIVEILSRIEIAIKDSELLYLLLLKSILT